MRQKYKELFLKTALRKFIDTDVLDSGGITVQFTLAQVLH